MSVLEQIVLGFQSLGYALRQIARPSLWTPWLFVLAVQIAALAFLWGFAHPAVSWLAAPLLRRVAGEDALHYPALFLHLPALYGPADLLVGALLGAVAAGASTALFGAWFAGQPLRASQGLRRAASRAAALVIANLPATLFLFGFTALLDRPLSNPDAPGLLLRSAPLITFVVAVVLQGWFLWVNPLLMLGRRGLVETFALLGETARHGLWTGLTLAILATLPLLPIQFLLGAADRIVDQGTPETVGWLLVLQTLIALVSAFALTGASALAYQSIVGPALEDA
jgi:hypothetical protein